ncbi:MAG: biopolymer transporter ExbD [Planctomycetota bacterium]|nr:biopolymer transporter ExbD [Planctomycetota bacterium]
MAEDALPEEFAAPPHSGTMKPRRALEDTEMDITPMIDITFLLLIFFIVASKMDEAANVPLPPAKTGKAILVKQCVIITVGPGDTDDTAKVYAGDGDAPENLVDSSDVDALEKALQDYVEEQVSSDPHKTMVLIKGGKGVKYKHVYMVGKSAARVAAITQMNWAVMEVN